MTSLRTFDALISCSCSVRLNATSVVHTCSYHSAGRRLLVPPNHIVGDHHQSNPVAHFGQSRCQRSSANHGDFYPCCDFVALVIYFKMTESFGNFIYFFKSYSNFKFASIYMLIAIWPQLKTCFFILFTIR